MEQEIRLKLLKTWNVHSGSGRVSFFFHYPTVISETKFCSFKDQGQRLKEINFDSRLQMDSTGFPLKMNKALFNTWKMKGFYFFNKTTPPKLQRKKL